MSAERKIFDGNLWDSDYCKQADEERKRNPELAKEKDKIISKQLSLIGLSSVKPKLIYASDILKKVSIGNGESLPDDEISEEDLKMLKSTYSENWRIHQNN